MDKPAATNQEEEDDFDSLLDECTKKLDTKLTVQSQPSTTPTQTTQASQPTVQNPEGQEPNMQEMQKIFEEMMKGMGNPSAGADTSAQAGVNPFLKACQQMFKEFEQASKDELASAVQGEGSSTGAEDPMMMNFLNMFSKELLNPDGTPKEGGGDPSGAGMDKLMSEFTNFLQNSEGNDDMKGALESVVSELLNKETLYEPMKTMRDEYPQWLEDNWDKVSVKQLEMYNAQLEKITEICTFYEANPQPSADQQTQAFELLHQLQELGSPPDELMRKIQEKQLGSGAGAGMGGGLFGL
ncbi:hypothetical protein FGO68_gene12001 [Halteria grandinella]|uniref:Peroxin-19 n=1 Tax=Halteria grandinella TaxID=5974 RepID=A0A8J8NQI4_HALGN|nr:hypothetical protein FGO68_gene12001 [Halteria grandinella]